MTQRDLFGDPGLEPAQQVVARQAREQEANLKRVTVKVRDLILAFCAERGRSAEPFFCVSELSDYVAVSGARCAPASADRILRSLRQAGEIGYRVTDRSRSLYEVLP